ncbi:hypothetical protein H5410_049322 [Solanum commersonii]|uniref:Uncharacterized protein n=1 Tax=Solanum commersonii TaxID=4109 RepID=A0A9J5WTS6_SOLCO|nr:hypothetical protein H5410_049322 [Solanum commersonii]
MEPVCHHCQKDPFRKSNIPQSSPQHLMVTQNFDVIYAKNIYGPPLRPWLWIQFVATTKIACLLGQTSHRVGKFPILPIFVRYSPRYFMLTQNSNVIYAKNLHGPPLRHSL